MGLARTSRSAEIETAQVLIRHSLPELHEYGSLIRPHTIAHELLHALGMKGHPRDRRDSILQNVVRDTPLETFRWDFRAIDRKTLRFLYQHLKPGDEFSAVKRAFDAHWRSTPDS